MRTCLPLGREMALFKESTCGSLKRQRGQIRVRIRSGSMTWLGGRAPKRASSREGGGCTPVLDVRE